MCITYEKDLYMNIYTCSSREKFTNDVPVLGTILFHELLELVVFERFPETFPMTFGFLIVTTVASSRHFGGY